MAESAFVWYTCDSHGMIDFSKYLKANRAKAQEESVPKTTSKPAKGGKQQFDDTNRGVLFVNDKDGVEERPDFTGNLAINPDDYTQGDDGLIRIRLAAWNKKSEKVGEFLSISASAPRQS